MPFLETGLADMEKELNQKLSSAEAVHHPEDELLFGRAGYLYALLWVRPRGAWVICVGVLGF